MHRFIKILRLILQSWSTIIVYVKYWNLNHTLMIGCLTISFVKLTPCNDTFLTATLIRSDWYILAIFRTYQLKVFQYLRTVHTEPSVCKLIENTFFVRNNFISKFSRPFMLYMYLKTAKLSWPHQAHVKKPLKL